MGSDAEHDKPAPPISSGTQSADSFEAIINMYYRCFNERRLEDAAALFTDDAVVEQVTTSRAARGGAAYLQFAREWLAAFPDATVSIEHVSSFGESRTREVALLGTGTHQGPLTIAGRVFKPTGVHASLHLRELLTIDAGRLVFSSLAFDLHELLAELVRADVDRLLVHLERLQRLQEQLRATRHDPSRSREVVNVIALELDTARNVARPYYGR